MYGCRLVSTLPSVLADVYFTDLQLYQCRHILLRVSEFSLPCSATPRRVEKGGGGVVSALVRSMRGTVVWFLSSVNSLPTCRFGEHYR